MPHELVIGSRRVLGAEPPVSELLSIDHEIGHPYLTRAGLYNSEAWSRKLELPWVIARIGPARGLRILDVGPGFSALPIYLHRHGARVVSADPQMSTVHRDGPSRVRAALPRLPFRDSAFDIVVCVSVLEHLPFPLPDVLAELLRLARHRLLLTFDLAFGPLAKLGLSRIELRAIEKAVGSRAIVPPDPLLPSEVEISLTGPNVMVGLLMIDLDSGDPIPLALSPVERFMVAIQRGTQRGVRLASDWLGLLRPPMS